MKGNMNPDPNYQKLRELSWRRKLTDAEEAELRAFLVAHPEAQADWEAEAGLNEALHLLPDAEVPSNFTARVLQTVERETAERAPRGTVRFGFWRRMSRWLPRAAVVAVAAGLGLFSYHRHQVAERKERAKSVALISHVASMPTAEWLQDFDAIQKLGQTPRPDEELLALLK
jgi:anti-sigma factor RsiW